MKLVFVAVLSIVYVSVDGGAEIREIMKEKIIVFINEFLIIQMNHWILFTIGMTILGIFGRGTPNMLEWGFCGIFPFLLYLVRMRWDKFIPFISMHILLTIAMVFVLSSDSVRLLIYAVYLIGYVINSIYIRVVTKDGMNKALSPIGAAICVAAMLLIMNSMSDKNWDVYYTAVLIAFLGMYFIHYYITRYLRFVKVNENTAGYIPKSEIFNSGMAAVSVYAFLCVVLLIFTADISWFSPVIEQIKEGLLWLLRQLFRLLRIGESTKAVDDIKYIDEFSTPALEVVETKEAFWLWTVLEYVIVAVIICLVIYIFIKNVTGLVNFFKTQFGRTLKKQVYVSKDITDVKEKCEIVKEKASGKGFFAFLQPDERVRKLFKKRVLKGRELLIGQGDPGLLNMITARECGRRLNVEELARVYEKVRYSGMECTAEDVKRAKMGRQV